ncbi:MAG: gamma-glutamylcyclotransferase [Rhizobiales bacterium]|nr:gamma-glutamylcyclotransferase [Hyphomicrobiales bacterium]
MGTESPLRVFGYGSLMWQPGFPYVAASRGRLVGWHRSFCVYSVQYRGTLARPGLVLGLQRRGTCDGMVFEVAPEDRARVIAYLRKREQAWGVYQERRLKVHLADSGACVEALTFVAEALHPNFAGELKLTDVARIIRSSRGPAGTNLEYFVRLHAALKGLGIRDWHMSALARAIGPADTPERWTALCNANARADRPAGECRANLSKVAQHKFVFRSRLNGGGTD